METTRKTYKYKLRPTNTQERTLWGWLHACRHLYNTALEQRKTAWKYHQVSLTRFQQEAELKDIRSEFSEYASVHSHVLQDVIARVDRAFQGYFRRVKSGEKAGYPRFQGVNRYHSFTFKEYGNGARLDNGFLVLSKMGRIKVIWSRVIEGIPKTVTISQETDGWFVTFSCAEVPCQALPRTGNAVGIDVGLKSFLTTSDGEMVPNPRYYRKAEKTLKQAHKRVSRRKKGSHRRKKAIQLLRVAYQKVTRQREYFHHKTARSLVQQYDVIYHEQLQVRNMVKNHYLAKSISDAGWSQFLTILQYKAACAGKEVLAVPARYTSQDCSNILPDGSICKERVPKSLSVRTHVCPTCGYVADRDENAAMNIKWAGQALRGLVGIPAGLNRESVGL